MLDLPISTIMERNLVTVGIDDTVAKVQQVMDLGLSCIPVLDQRDNCFGVISCRDLVHFELLERNPRLEKAWEICSHRVISADESTTIRDACIMILDARVHHLIATRKRVIAGVVSSLDVLKCMLDAADARSDVELS